MIAALNFNHDRIKYVVWHFGESQPEINIDGHELVYCQLGETHHGTQCNHVGGTSRHRLIQSKLKKITELFRDIDYLNEK